MFEQNDPILRLNRYLDEVAEITAIPGTSVSKRFDATLAAWRELEAIREADASAIVRQIGDTVRDGNRKALDGLVREWRLAQSGQAHELIYELAGETHAHLRGFYLEDSAQKNHKVVAAAFNEKADRLTQLASIVDIGAESKTLITASDKERTAWVEAEVIAENLTRLVPLVMTAIHLAGHSLSLPGLDPEDEPIAATVDATGLHRRRVFEAWRNNEHRAKRWGALLDLGATIHAATLDELEPYRAPQPMVTTYKRVQYGHEIIETDPENLAEVQTA